MAWLALLTVFLGPGKGIPGTLAGFGVVLLIGLRGRGLLGVVSSSGKSVWNMLAGFGAGLGIFVLLVRLGMASWPLTRAASPSAYAFLLLCHLMLVLAISAGFLLLSFRPGTPHCLRWGRWGRGRVVLGLSSFACVGAAVYNVLSHRPVFAAWLAPVVVIALLKAALTGVGEEVFYRGLLQPSAVAHFGRAWGIVFQAGLYMLFHVFLNQSFLPQIAFLVFVFGLGLVFGIVTQATNGIGWAALIHTALDVVVEWSNIC